MRDVEGKVIGAIETLQDITERRRAEEKIHRQQEELQIILDSVPALVFYKDKEDRFIRVNKALTQAFNMSKEEIIGKTAVEISPGKDYWEDDKKVMKTGISLRNIIEPIETPEGTKWAQTDKIPYKDSDGNIVGIIGFSVDITERKKADEKLRESEIKYRELIDGMNETVWIIDFNGDLIDVNNTAIEFLGYSKEELLTMGLYGIDSSLKKGDIKALAKSMQSDKRQIFETSHTTKDGRTFPIEVSSSLVTYQGKQAILSIARDITERKQAEAQRAAAQEALQESEERYRMIFDNISDQIVYVNKYGTIIAANDKEEIFGRKQEEIVGKHFTKLGFFGAKDIPKMLKLFKDVITGKRTIKMMEMEVRHKDGHEIPVEVSTNIIKKNGKIEGFLCLVRDITERVRAEAQRAAAQEALRKSEENFRNIFQSVPESLLSVSKKIKVLNSNKAFAELIQKYAPVLNMSEDELREKIILELRKQTGKKERGVIEIRLSERSGND